jgi:OFA family oxalate/formate antiporter-like MFS transporter
MGNYTESAEMTKKPAIFHGWLMAAACFAMTMVVGETVWSFGVFFKPLEEEFSWSRTLVSSGYSAMLIGYAISVIVVGRLIDRYKPRHILLASALLGGLGICLCSQAHSINQLRIAFLFTGLGTGANWIIPTVIIQRWFYGRPRAGLALATVVAGGGVGSLIFAPLFNHLILTYEWRKAFIVASIIFIAIVVTSSLVIKPSQADYQSTPTEDEKKGTVAATEYWSTSTAIHTSSFHNIIFVYAIAVLSFQIMTVHFVPYATDVGISPVAAAAALGLTGGTSVPGRIISGLMSTKIGWQKTVALSLFGMALSMSLLLFIKSAWMLYSFVLLYGICHGIRMPALLGIIGEFFGMHSLGELIGIAVAISLFVGAFAPFAAGFMFDLTSTYSAAFIILIALLMGGGVVAAVMKKPYTKT